MPSPAPKPLPPPTAAEVADWIAKAKAAAARNSDLVVAVLGEVASMSGEAASRATLDLPGMQEQMLETVAATGKPVVLVLGERPPTRYSLGGSARPSNSRGLVSRHRGR